MRRPPPIADFLKYPVTVTVALLAAAVTMAWHSGRDISPLVMDFHVWEGQPWRLLTSSLPHVDFLHLAFNLYWLWVFGTAVERNYGSFYTALIVIFFSAGSSAAEYAIFEGGVGLSGVGYGLFGLVWVLGSRDERFHGVVDAQIVSLFVVWFFLCIALTASGTWAVANVAHGIGAAQGILLGFALTAERSKHLVIAGLVGLMLVVFTGATIGRPYINFSSSLGEDLAQAGYIEFEQGHDERAVALYERAIQLNDHQALWYGNLGIGYQRLDREADATEAYQRAAKLEPNSAVYRGTLAACLASVAYRKQSAGQNEAAVDLYSESLVLDGQNARNWFNLGIAYQNLGRRDGAASAYEKAVNLKPEDSTFRAALDTLRGLPRD